jgi:hypothetical protein
MTPEKLAGQLLRWTMGEVIVLAVLLFIPAWTIDCWQAWMFIVVFVVSTKHRPVITVVGATKRPI